MGLCRLQRNVYKLAGTTCFMSYSAIINTQLPFIADFNSFFTNSSTSVIHRPRSLTSYSLTQTHRWSPAPKMLLRPSTIFLFLISALSVLASLGTNLKFSVVPDEMKEEGFGGGYWFEEVDSKATTTLDKDLQVYLPYFPTFCLIH